MKEITIGKNEENQRIDRFIKKYLNNAPLGMIYKFIRKKTIKVNNARTVQEYMLKENDVVQIYLSDESLAKLVSEKKRIVVKKSFKVIYEDENILIVDKPKNLLVHGDSKEKKNTLTNQVLNYLYDKNEYDPAGEKTFSPASVNRLDRNTSGMVIFGKNYTALQSLNEIMRARDSIKKYYMALVIGKIEKPIILEDFIAKDTLKNKVNVSSIERASDKKIITKVRPLITGEEYSLVEVELITGRTHQIRAHLSSIGHPIVGDIKYGEKRINELFFRQYDLESQYLHAYKLEFLETNEQLSAIENKAFYSKLSMDMERIIKSIFKTNLEALYK